MDNEGATVEFKRNLLPSGLIKPSSRSHVSISVLLYFLLVFFVTTLLFPNLSLVPSVSDLFAPPLQIHALTFLSTFLQTIFNIHAGK